MSFFFWLWLSRHLSEWSVRDLVILNLVLLAAVALVVVVGLVVLL